MLVRRIIHNPILEAITYDDFMKELTPSKDGNNYTFRNNPISKGIFCDWFFLMGTNCLMQPGMVWILDLNNNVVESLWENELERKYWIGGI